MDDKQNGATPGGVRLADVAKAAGVGIATASRALSNVSRVNSDTRKQVLEAARRLGYVGNLAARSLRSGLSRIVLVIMPIQHGMNVLEALLRGIDAELRQSGYSMIVSAIEQDGSTDPRLMEIARGGLVDGLLAITNWPLDSGKLAILSAELPSIGLLVDLGRFGVRSVVVAEREGVRALATHLIDVGRRHLLFVGGPAGYHTDERLAGFNDAVAAAPRAVRTLFLDGDYTADAGRQVAEQVLRMTDRPDGAVFTNDRMAMVFMAAVRAAGVRVPQDIAVTGFDDIEMAAYCDPPLTTYRQPMDAMGAAAVRLLLGAIRGEAPDRPLPVVMQGDIVFRASG